MTTLAASFLDWIVFKYKITDGFEIRQDPLRDYGTRCPSASGKIPIEIIGEMLSPC